MEKAMFGAGCFWGVEDAFRKVEGVRSTAVGYAGGRTENPTYEQVCSHTTGHAEVVLVEFDPAVVPYERLVETFFTIHDPTQLNRQGPDIGDQYRSAIFTFDEAQKATAERVMDRFEAEGRVRGPIVTEITPAPTFWRAEEYHQQYFEKTGRSHCLF
ncbi:MAG TPA: peptide-methionine (S)-S-oxide reductase MsrA [Alphaproteobacteria bacterium]|jgi:peptide-methionine (S)-S-oxide reductase